MTSLSLKLIFADYMLIVFSSSNSFNIYVFVSSFVFHFQFIGRITEYGNLLPTLLSFHRSN